ncbi:2-oxoisovalerate dehydrogenase [bacterium]|nr:2-oxoisovalerate dehydrogenase [bacterium]
MSQRGQNRNKAKKTDSEIIFLVEESPEGGYDARALGYSIFTQAESLSDLREALKDAVRCHFNKNERPRLIRLHLVKEEVIPA